MLIIGALLGVGALLGLLVFFFEVLWFLVKWGLIALFALMFYAAFFT